MNLLMAMTAPRSSREQRAEPAAAERDLALAQFAAPGSPGVALAAMAPAALREWERQEPPTKPVPKSSGSRKPRNELPYVTVSWFAPPGLLCAIIHLRGPRKG